MRCGFSPKEEVKAPHLLAEFESFARIERAFATCDPDPPPITRDGKADRSRGPLNYRIGVVLLSAARTWGLWMTHAAGSLTRARAPCERKTTLSVDFAAEDVATVSKYGAATRHQDESKEKSMQYAMLIYETPENFESRKKRDNDDYIGAWRAYHKALVEAGVHAGGDPLHAPETATTVKVKEGRRQVQDGPFADTKEQLGGFTILECPSLDVALEWAARCPAAASGAVEVRPLAPDVRCRVTD
jgi:hypothetical protein